MKAETYRARPSKRPIPREYMDLVRRRTNPFLDSVGMAKPLSALMQEAYIQGVRDTVQAFEQGLSQKDASPDSE